MKNLIEELNNNEIYKALLERAPEADKNAIKNTTEKYVNILGGYMASIYEEMQKDPAAFKARLKEEVETLIKEGRTSIKTDK